MEHRSVNSFIFDLDDTLCNYEITVEEALTYAFDEAGFSSAIIDREDLQRGFEEEFEKEMGNQNSPDKGFRKRVFFNLLRDRDSFSKSDIEKVSDYFRQIREEKLNLVDGAKDLLNRLAENRRLGLLTNGPSTLQCRKIEILDIAPLFETIVVSGDHGISKPDPRIFLRTLEKMNEKPQNSAYIGNSVQYDVNGAKNAGILAIWVDRGEEEVSSEDSSPDLIINNLRELTEDTIQSMERSKTKRTTK